MFGVDQGRKEFESALKACLQPEDRLCIYHEWIACARATHEALSGKQTDRDRVKAAALWAEAERVREAAAVEFPSDRWAAAHCHARGLQTLGPQTTHVLVTTTC